MVAIVYLYVVETNLNDIEDILYSEDRDSEAYDNKVSSIRNRSSSSCNNNTTTSATTTSDNNNNNSDDKPCYIKIIFNGKL
jgi:hypothetical protein